MSVSFGWPIALFALVAVPLLLLFGMRSKLMRSPARRRQLAFLRVLAVTCVVLALAGLRVGLPTDELSVALVVDGTPRIADSERRAIEGTISAAETAHPGTFTTATTTGDTARDLRLAASTLPRDRVRRVLLATDGREPTADLRVAIDAARRDGTEVWIAPLGDHPVVDVASLAAVTLPRLVRAGETVGVAVSLHTSRATSIPLTVTLDGEPNTTETIAAAAGSSTHTVPVTFPEDEGVHSLELAIDASGSPDNDRWQSLVRVVSRPRVLLVHSRAEGEPALAAVLRDAELNVELVPPSGAPTDRSALDPYALVVIDETDPGDLTEPQQRALRTWVEEDGGGLVTITGNHAVRREPAWLRAIEPIRPPPAIPEPRPLELVIVIDRSSSMGGSSMSQARRGAATAVRALRVDARVGVVAFSSGPDRVLPLQGMDQVEQVVGFIGSIEAGGGTDIGAALRAANRVVSDDSRYIRHVILLSDGESDPWSAIDAATAIAARGVSISAISIGGRTELMSEIARIGRGRYHVTSDPSSLPRLFVHEAQYRQPPAHREVRFTPRVVTPLQMLAEVPFGDAPSLSGYALAVARPGATTVLSTPDEGALLAHWYVGVGQVASFASATDGGWADEWRTWDGFRTFWSSLAWGMLRTRTVEPVELHLTTPIDRPGTRVLTVVAGTTSLTPVPVVELHRDRTSTAPVELAPRGPGVWQAELPLGRSLLVTARMPRQPEPTAAVGDEEPYRRALRRFGVDSAGVTGLAALGGGRVLEDPSTIVNDVEPRAAMVEARTALLVLGLFLYLASLLLLRLPDRRRDAAPALPAAEPARPQAMNEAA